jgi:hypothetical protein
VAVRRSELDRAGVVDDLDWDSDPTGKAIRLHNLATSSEEDSAAVVIQQG